MSPNKWGPPTWVYIHTLAEKIKEEEFDKLGPQLIQTIINICSILPCPECSKHATNFWRKVNLQTIGCKEDLKKVLFVFHNTVNKRKNKPLFAYEKMDTYSSKRLTDVFIHFRQHFKTNGNMNLINESFHRQRLLLSVKYWMLQNNSAFNLL